MLALLAEQAEICPMCGHPKSECRDPKTAYSWRAEEQICNASRMAEVAAENNRKAERPKRGLVIYTRRVG